ncbi:hypothetical protein O181_097868 [Austropuccinia psidii MF-1]|uniref:Uncharacterized protein n=1 Tax=Austropuccinia psidii MF-1 TaxID=1389203 RepID=A0A9Q3PDK9_9BASI|nr:hypothetical protein [Austropuccinia psidii MF-1]
MPLTRFVNLSAETGCFTKVIYCDCNEPTLAAMSINQRHRVYLHCPRKDANNRSSKDGCKFFAWMDDYVWKNSLFKVPVLVTVQPILWEKEKRGTSTAFGNWKSNEGSISIYHGAKRNQTRDLRALIELIDSTIATTNQGGDMSTVIGRMYMMRRVLRTLVEDADLFV